MRDLHTVFDVLIPIPYSPYGLEILEGSGIVGRQRGTSYVIDYEGNCYGAENLRSFEARVFRAAERAAVNYPTVARMAIGQDEAFVKVGEYDHAAGTLVLFDNPTGLRMLQEWLGDEPVPGERRETSDLWRVVQVHAAAAGGEVPPNDRDVPGVYDVEVPCLCWQDGAVAAAALHRFHSVVPVGDMDAFEFAVRDGHRELVPAVEHTAEGGVIGGAVSKREVAA